MDNTFNAPVSTRGETREKAAPGNRATSSKDSVKVGVETVEQLDEEGVAKELAPLRPRREAILSGGKKMVEETGSVSDCTSPLMPWWLLTFQSFVRRGSE